MIKVFIPSDKNFNYKECKSLFRKLNKFIKDTPNFRKIVETTFFYSFFDDEKFLGCIYFYKKNGKLFVNAFAKRHSHALNIKCFKMTFNWFNCDIYAQTQHKTAIFCLYKCGFKNVSNNLYKLERK